jgi:demethylmenaquinone methyltransferase/2-methoxy-6-polyprenyl-1,4-benzoquinol methylase
MKRYPSVGSLTAAGHAGVVADIFTTAHARYDFLNHLLSLRRDVGWRDCAVRRMRFGRTRRLLDVATGTADLAIAAALRHPRVSVTGIDVAEPMLREARRKLRARGLEGRVSLRMADALALPFPARSFDVTAAAFGMRNLSDKLSALREMARVTVSGGQVMILEMSFAPARVLRGIYGFYLTRLLPRVAALFSPNPAAYSYLADSIVGFPRPDAFSAMMRQAGLCDVRHHSLSFGTAHLHVGRVGGAREGT